MRRVFFKISLGLLSVVALNFVIASFLIISISKREYHKNLKDQLYAEARFVSEFLKYRTLDTANSAQIDEIVKTIGKDLETRITIILPDGNVYADSAADPKSMENHKNRIEVQTALAGRIGQDTRISPTLGIRMAYLAIPVTDVSGTSAVVRVTLPESLIQARINRSIYQGVFIGTLLAGIVALVLGFLVSRHFSLAIESIKDAAYGIARGDFKRRLNLHTHDELQQAAESINEMSEQLGRMFEAISDEKERIAAILTAMKQPLALIGMDNTVYLVNDAVCELFKFDCNKVIGKKYWEVFLVMEISQFIKEALEKEGVEDRPFTLKNERGIERHYLMSASGIISNAGQPRGIVLILHNISAMKEADKMRRDFVDNASHELKTPISSVSAIAETLIDREPTEQETRQKFFQTIFENCQRLDNLVNDLICLSEIEQKRQTLDIKPYDVSAFLHEIADQLAPAIKAREHTLKWDVPDHLPPINIDKKHFSRALSSILDNAIRYTEKGGEITISVSKEEGCLSIAIKDNGVGIAEADISRIFERFYRVDKARSIKQGGTGLGLSIARHIVEAHGARIAVESAPGKGSTFRIIIPF